jgi:hypothetical protein
VSVELVAKGSAAVHAALNCSVCAGWSGDPSQMAGVAFPTPLNLSVDGGWP